MSPMKVKKKKMSRKNKKSQLRTQQERKEAKRRKAEKKREKKRILEERLFVYSSRFSPSLSSRETVLESATLHLGPTNSGKTYHAMQAMIEAFHNGEKIIAYRGPLRLLAYEVYHRLVDEIGKENVGLITGDHEINPEAPVLACTVECVPEYGDLLVIDEAHFCNDPDRGHSWTKALASHEYRNIIVLGPSEIRPQLELILNSAKDLSVHHHDRLSPLKFDPDPVTTSQLKPRTAVVSFSKKSVIALANEIEENTNLTAEALYGRLPVGIREDVSRRFRNGEIDVIVTTDVIGHGLNLPIDNLLFAETYKYDGTPRRALYTWEAAQIAGRAGRYGISETGTVGILQTKWGTTWNRIVEKAVLAARGDIKTELSQAKMTIKPTLRSIGNPGDKDYDLIPKLVQKWTAYMSQVIDNMPDDYSRAFIVSPCTIPITALRMIRDHYQNKKVPEVDVHRMWDLGNAPIDPDSNVFRDAIPLVNNPDVTGKLKSTWKLVQFPPKHTSSIENSISTIVDLRVIGMIFGDEDRNIPGVVSIDELLYKEQELMDIYITLDDKSSIGKCISCGKMASAPWLSYCEECYNRDDGYYMDDFGCYRSCGNYNDYEFDAYEEERHEERLEEERKWRSLRSAASRKIIDWYSVGDEVKIKYRGRLYPATVAKKNKVTMKITWELKNGSKKEKNVQAVYIAKDMDDDRLKSCKEYQEFLAAENLHQPYM